MRFTVDRLDHLVLNCRDVEITAAWYQRVLGMEREEFGPDRRTALKFGGQKINLRPMDADVRSWITGASAVPGTAEVWAGAVEASIARLANPMSAASERRVG